MLADITVDGKPVKAVLESSKQAFMYVFDRVTGKPVWPIEERPVEKGDVPGEWYSPTQPFPTKPPAFDYQGVTVDNLIDFTPELRALAKDMVARYKLGPIFTPPVISKADGPTCLVPIVGWHELARVFVRSRNAHCLCTLVYFFPSGRSYSSTQQGILGYRLGRGRYSGGGSLRIWSGRKCGGRFEACAQGTVGRGAAAAAPAAAEGRGALNPQGLPLLKPPYGRITAINMDRGEFAWQIAHGDTPDYVRNHPALKGLNIPRTGQSGYVGILVTKSLVIAADPQVTTTSEHPRGAMLHAYDKATGKELGAVWMPAPQSGTPMTYMFNGRQYIVIAISGGSYTGEYLAFALPRE